MNLENKNLKGALCLYGQPRYFFNNDTLIKNIMNIYSIDVFYHTWWDECGTYEIAPWAHGSHERDMSQLDMRKYDLNMLYQMYKPKQFQHEPQIDFSTQVVIPSQDVVGYIRDGNVLSQYYSSKKSSILQQTYDNYSFIIRARFDTFIEHPLNLSKYLTEDGRFPENTLIIPDNCHNPNLYNDNFSISSPTVHSYICRIYDHVQQYLYDGVPYSPEELFKHHVELGGIKVVKDSNIHQMFFRGVNYVHP